MKNEDVQTNEGDDDMSTKEVHTDSSTYKPSSTIPLLITIIGIFSYLGVVLPSVFNSSMRLYNYTLFDVVIMIGGAALVGLGAYFLLKIRAKIYLEKKKSLELA